jgi:hypothetical protein
MMADGFLSRWSKRKAGKEIELEKVQEEAPPSTITPAPEVEATPPVTLEDVEKIDRFDPDFSAFMRPDVDPSVQQAALKKMFTDPHFNVMDGLDIYIDDYSNPEPLPSNMLKRLVQSDLLGIFNKPEELVAGVLSPSEKSPSLERGGDDVSEALTQSDLRSEQLQQNPMDPEATDKVAQQKNIKEDKA